MAIKKEPPVKTKKKPPTKKPPIVANKGQATALQNVKVGQTLVSGQYYPFKTKKTATPVNKKAPVTKAPPINTAATKPPVKKIIKGRERYAGGKLISKEYQDSTGKWIKQL